MKKASLSKKRRMWILAIILILVAAGYLGVRHVTHPGSSHGTDESALRHEALASGGPLLAERLRSHVEKIATEIGPRGYTHLKALRATEAWIVRSLTDAGLAVSKQAYQVGDQVLFNIEALLHGTQADEPALVIGAHYDSVDGCPGANDNGSGVAALLELARHFASAARSGKRLLRTVRFVAFVNEEPPFFQTDVMGSLVYARACKERGDRLLGMLSIETIGYFSDQGGSQSFPPGLGLLYPGTGNFIAFVGNFASRSFLDRSLSIFRASSSFPSEGASLPGFVPGVGWSDHWSFWQCGYPAFMVTDTALFRYPFYHDPRDTPAKIDYERMADVVSGLAFVVEGLAR
ncbi:MAG: M28 family peptidase [Planctomycetota bacterium]